MRRFRVQFDQAGRLRSNYGGAFGDTREEYALARTERKSGRGYHGFVFRTEPVVTLEEDLERRDLTINAMARDEHGALIDPFGGAADLAAGRLRTFL